MTALRLFVAIDLPPAMADCLRALDPHQRGLTFSPPEQMHLTLAFFARVPPETITPFTVQLAAISFRAFFLPVIGLGAFSRKRDSHILWVGVGHAHPHLFQLHKRVSDAALACNLPIEERAWKPHFTIARACGVSKSQITSFTKKHRDDEIGTFRVAEVHLYQSKLTSAGAIHSRLLTITSS